MKNLVYGYNTIFELLKTTNRIQKLYSTTDNKQAKKLAKDFKIDIVIKDKSFFTQLSKVSQNIAAKVKDYKYGKLFDLFNLSTNEAVLILDQIQDPYNFGAIIRSAVSANFRAIIIANKKQVEITPVVEKVSLGLSSKINIIKTANIVSAIKSLQKHNFWVYASLIKNAKDYRSIDYTGNVAIVIGNEGKGIRPLVAKTCDQSIYIPMSKNVESLNVSVATGIICQHIYNFKNPL